MFIRKLFAIKIHVISFRYCNTILSLGVCRLSSTAGSYWDIHARENPHFKDLTNSNIQSSLVAEGP